MSSPTNAASAAGAPRLANLARLAAPMTPAQARAAGLRYYFGVPCAYGHHRRYTANRMCVTCSAAHHVARKAGTRREPPPPAPLQYIAPSLEVGRRLGLVHYHGRPHTCGSTVRYVHSTKCVKCEAERQARRWAARAAR